MSHKIVRPLFVLILLFTLTFTGFTPADAAPPSNDDFANAEAISSLPFSTTVDNTEATVEPVEPVNCGSLFQSVWFSFTPTEAMAIRMSVDSPVGGSVEIYLASGPTFADLSFLACASAGELSNVQLQTGQTYYLRVDSFGQTDSLQVNVEQITPPANDNFADAEVINTLPFSSIVDNTDATTELDESIGCGSIFQSLWYSFTPADDIAIRVGMDGSQVGGNVNLYLVSGPTFADLTLMDCVSSGSSKNLQLQGGQTYYLQVDSFNQAGILQVNVEQITPPANDNFVNAEAINSLPFSSTVDNTEATVEPAEPLDCSFPFRSVWYSFMPADDMAVRVDTADSQVGGIVAVFIASGPGISDLTALACANNNFSTNLQLQAGQTYYLQVDSFGEAGTVQVNVEQITPPANDNFANAEVINALPFSASVDTTDATMELNEPLAPSCGSILKTVWYSFTPAENTAVRLDMPGGSPGGSAYVYIASGPAISDLAPVGCTLQGTSLNIQLQGGETYYLQVSGVFQLSLEQFTPAANDNFANAESIPSLPHTIVADNTNATTEPGEGIDCASQFRSLWYSFSPTENMEVRLNTFGSIAPGNVSIYRALGPSISDLSFLTCTTGGSSARVQLEAGQTYYLRVDSYGGAGAIQVNIEPAIPPANDDFANAESVTGLPFSATVDLSDATTEPDEPQNCYNVNQTSWYVFTPTQTTRVQVDTQGSVINGSVNIYQAAGPGLTGLQFLQCSDPFSAALFTAEAGQTYYLQVGNPFGETGTVQVNLAEVPIITGRAVDAITGAPLPGDAEPFTYVHLYRICGEGCLESVDAQQADSEGRFFFEGIPAGSYQIEITASLYQVKQFGPFAFDGTRLDVGDVPLNPPAVIRGRVVDAVTGNPLPGVSVFLWRCDAGSCIEFVGSQNADEHGQFSINSLNNGTPLPGGTYEVEIADIVHETRRIQVVIADSEIRDLGDVALTPLPLIGSISGRLVDAATRRPLPQLFTPVVNLYRCTDGNCFQWVNSQAPDVQGAFRFETDFAGNPLIVGTYRVVATADQYQDARTDPFEVGEGMHRTIGNLRITSFPVRFSNIQPCADLPSSGGACEFSVRIWNGLATTLRGNAWSLVNANLPDSFAGITDFQANPKHELDLEKGRSKILRFRINVPAARGPSGAFVCTRVFAARGSSLFNTVGFRDLFCFFRTAQGLALASPQEARAPAQADVTPAATVTEIEPNDSCQASQDAGAVPLPFMLDGNLDSSQTPDVDFFRFTGTSGTALSVDLAGHATNQVTLGDPFLGFFNSNCDLIAINDDFHSLNSHLDIIIPDDGVFILAATHCCDSGFTGGGNGTYQLTIASIPVIGSISGRVIDGLSGAPLRGDVEPFAYARLLRCEDSTCVEVNVQPMDSQGRFRFVGDSNGAPLRTGNYQIAAFANQYNETQSEPFAVGEGENHNVGNVPLSSIPVRFSHARPCSVPAEGGVCEFSIRITNGLTTRLKGRAWSMVSSSGTSSFTNFTGFQINTPQNVTLDPGRSRALRFQFRVPASVANGASICGLVYVGQNPSPYFNPAGLNLVFCLVKGEGGFSLMSSREAQALQMQTPMLRFDTPDQLTEKKK
jgi:5-hydroxyisourate hydrolase-like protein (transthyretin family)